MVIIITIGHNTRVKPFVKLSHLSSLVIGTPLLSTSSNIKSIKMFKIIPMRK